MTLMKSPTSLPSDPQEPKTAVQAAMLAFLARYIRLTPEEVDLVLDHAECVFFPKDHVILEEGQTSVESYFIMSGLVRQYVVVEGVERTTYFYGEEEAMSLYTDVMKPGPSPHYLVCVEDTVAIRCSDGTGLDAFAAMPRFEPVARVIAEKSLRAAHQVLSDFLMLSPEDRYRHLLRTRPDLIQRVPQYQLASYLGVAPESLSRIRKRIAKKV